MSFSNPEGGKNSTTTDLMADASRSSMPRPVVHIPETVIEIVDPGQALYDSSMQLSISSRRRAEILKYMNLFINLSIIFAGSAITINSAIDEPVASRWVGLTLGIFVTGCKSISSIFNLESKALILKQVSTQARIVSRDVGELLMRGLRDEVYRTELSRCFRRFDELDIQAFTATSQPVIRKAPSGGSSPTSSS